MDNKQRHFAATIFGIKEIERKKERKKERRLVPALNDPTHQFPKVVDFLAQKCSDAKIESPLLLFTVCAATERECD